MPNLRRQPPAPPSSGILAAVYDPSQPGTYSWESIGNVVTATSVGARSDGVTDDTAALNAAYARLPLGTAIMITAPTVIGGQLSIPSHMGLVGSIPGPFDLETTSFGNLPVLLVPNASVSPIATGAHDCVIEDLAMYWPNQVSPTAATPTVYPYAVLMNTGNQGHRVRRITFVNAYQGIRVYGSKHIVEDINSGCLFNDILLDFSFDVTHFHRIYHFSYWDEVLGLTFPQNIDTWVGANEVLFSVRRSDGFVLEDIEGYHGNYGLFCDAGSAGPPGDPYGSGTNVRFDTYGTPLYVKSTQSPGIQLANFSCNANVGSNPVVMPPGGQHTPLVRIVGGSFWGAQVIPSNLASGELDIKGVHGFNPAGTSKLAGGQPIFPLSTLSLANTTGVDCTVVIATGAGVTVSVIAIGGTSTGLTMAASSTLVVRVPANQTITLTYAGGTPTWTWFGD